MESSGVSRDEAAELLDEVQRQRTHAKRTLGTGWLVAGALGVAMLLGAVLSAAEVAGWIQAIVLGGLVIGAGVVGLVLAGRNESQFGVVLQFERGMLLGGIAGTALAIAVLVVMNDTTPSPRANGGAIGGACAIALAGVIWPRSRPRWVGRMFLIYAVTMVVSVVISPDSFVPRQLLMGSVLLSYAAWAWVRAGRRG